jgi:hypothetical protein
VSRSDGAWRRIHETPNGTEAGQPGREVLEVLGALVGEDHCRAMLVETAGTVNTGEVVCEKTAATDAWI